MRIITAFTRSILLVTLIYLVTLSAPAHAQIGSPKTYDNGLVVSADKYASEIGISILKKGGNAVDAAVAVNFALAVTYPQAGNIGGGGFMVIRTKDGNVSTLDFREKAPRKASQKMYQDDEGKYIPEKSRLGALAAGVPGTVDGMIRALLRYGNLPLDVVLEPAIDLAENGHKLSYSTAQALNDKAGQLAKFEASKKYFTKEDSSFSEGERFVQKDLAATLNRIAKFGREGFYSGETAEKLVATMEKHGGLVDLIDLKNYESTWRDPISKEIWGHTIHMMGPPSSGGVAISQILSMLQEKNIGKLEYHSTNYIHLLTETLRLAFADRAYFLGDPDFVDVPIEALTSDFYNRDRLTAFRWDTVTPSSKVSHGHLPGFEESMETTHFSVIDGDGNAVSVTTTLNGYFGCKLSVDGAGFVLNNEMDDFSAKPGEPNQFGLIGGMANAVKPNKRMLSSMTPTIATDSQTDEVTMLLGAAGGPRIITAVLQMFMNGALHQMNAQQAIAAPRIHHQWLPDELLYEEFGLNPPVKAKLRGIGHNLEASGSLARGHILFVNEAGNFEAGVDPRGFGYAAGY